MDIFLKFPKILLVLLLFLSACGDDAQLDAFTSDGCSLFPDSSWISDDNWCSCCVEHDRAYWQGGDESKRYIADLELHNCVLAKTESKLLAALMFEGVRVGGSPYLYTWFRWGYGWKYGRWYTPLSESEQVEVDRRVTKFVEQENTPVCGK